MRRLFLFGVITSAFIYGYAAARGGRSRDAFERICTLVSNQFYSDTPAVRAWIDRCRESARSLPRAMTNENLLARAQDLMDELKVSHFNVYAPAEDEKIWTGRAVHTGLRARFVDGFLLIYEVVPGSVAEAAGVRAGDEVMTMPGEAEVSPAGVAARVGRYVFGRAGRTFAVELTPAPIVVDGGLKLTAVDARVNVLTIPSFRAEYFTRAAWTNLVGRLDRTAGLIIDLRENSGGNFAAMLRALSVFTCGERVIGHLSRARAATDRRARLADQTDDSRQIAQLDRVRTLDLVTPAGYGCFDGPVITLISPRTSSVAEIFADAMTTRPRSRVWGWPTAGDVILAVWYDLPSLGPGFSVSIPRAEYINAGGRALEGAGVRPTRELFYDLELSRRGIDTWISAAARALR